MKKVVIVIGGAVVNMGSQAIVRGLIENIRNVSPNARIILSSAEKNFDKSINIPFVSKYVKRYSIEGSKINYPHVICALKRKFFKMKVNEKKYYLYNLLRELKKSDVSIIVGADNYDKSYNSLDYMWETNQFLDEIGRDKTILYNCSVDSEDLSDAALMDIRRFKYITVRDMISYNNIKNALPKNNISYFPDVAFCMKPELVNLPEGFDNNTIGINASSLIGDGRYGISNDEVVLAYKSMIDYIINNTNMKICLIPHVKNNADLSVLAELYAGVKDKSRVILIDHENYNAAQKKYIISKCRMFVGARTHSTIAAYSSCVPTFVIGYSVKSIGIATDLFGSYDGYVFNIKDISNKEYLMQKFIEFLSTEEKIRSTLEKVMPDYIEKASGIQEIIKEIMERN